MEHGTSDSSGKDKDMKNSFESYDDDTVEKESTPARKSSKETEAVSPAESGGLFGERKGADDDQSERPSFLASLVEKEGSDDLPSPPELPAAEVEDSQEAPDIEVLSDDESRYATQEIIDNRQAEVESELAEAENGSAEEVELAANAALLDALQEHLEAGDDAEAALEAAAEETLAEIADMAEANTDDAEEPAEPKEDEEVEEDDQQPSTPSKPLAPPQQPPLPPPPPTSPPNGPPPPPPGPGPQGPNMPPNGPAGPNNPGGPPFGPNAMPPNPNGSNMGPNFGPNLGPNAIPNNPNVIPIPVPVGVERRRGIRPRDALIGGVVGYLIGRRRGRINAENRLLPIQEQLEQQVSDLEQSIAQKEQQIRKAAREKLAPPQAAPEQVHRVSEELTRPVVLPTAERTPVVATERIISSERVTIPKTKEAEKALDARYASLTEVLALAATIEIGDKSVRQLFETGKLSQQEVRRLVAEYMRGTPAEALRPQLLGESERAEQDPLAQAGQPVELSSAQSTPELDAQSQGQQASGGAEGGGMQTLGLPVFNEQQNPVHSLSPHHSVPTPQPPLVSAPKQNNQVLIIGSAAIGLLIAILLVLLLK